MVSLAISAVFSTPSRMRAESKCVSAKHTVRSLTQAFWKSMHEALAQLNSPRDAVRLGAARSVLAPTWAAAGPGINAARRKTSGQTRRDLRLAAGRRTQNVRGGGISMGSRLQHRVQGTGRARGTTAPPRRAREIPTRRGPAPAPAPAR